MLTSSLTPAQALTDAGLPVELLSAEATTALNEMSAEEVQLLIDIQRRFKDLPLEPQMVEGGILF